MQNIKMLWKAWYGDEELTLDFPDQWQVVLKKMPGHDWPEVSDEQIKQVLANPIGAQRLREVAAGKKKAVIIFDDMKRPTPTWRILPFVLQELADAGFRDEQITFVAGTGNHAPLRHEDFVKKLGPDIPRRFRIYNHNVFEHFVDLGVTRRGTPIQINRQVANADVRIVIGNILPHFAAGYSGGAKLILPGVSSIDSITHNHSKLGLGGVSVSDMGGKRSRLGQVDGNDERDDMEEIARALGVHQMINVLVNGYRQIAAVFCGDIVQAHRAGASVAKEFYGTVPEGDCDIVIGNAYPIEAQPRKSLWPAGPTHAREGISAVLIANSTSNDFFHYLANNFGEDYGGRLWRKVTDSPAPQARRMYVFTENPSVTFLDTIAPPNQMTCCTTWSQIRDQLIADHGKRAKVAVYPCASVQMPART